MKVNMLLPKILAKEKCMKWRSSLLFYPLAPCPERSIIVVCLSDYVLCIYDHTSTFIIYEFIYNKDVYIKIYIHTHIIYL